jgi:predicted MFS family arabinose efflux permease
MPNQTPKGPESALGGSRTEAPFDRPTVVTLRAAHFVHGSYPPFIGILLPPLTTRLEMGLAAAGIHGSGIRWTTLLQRVLGHLADRRDTRAWVILARALTAIWICALVLAPSAPVAATLLLLASLSHAAFHPAAGAMVTRVAGGQWGTAAAYFMTGGELVALQLPRKSARLVVATAGGPVPRLPHTGAR